MSDFYMLFVEGGKFPVVRHDTKDEARAEAERLAIKYQGRKVWLLGVKACCEASKPAVMWSKEAVDWRGVVLTPVKGGVAASLPKGDYDEIATFTMKSATGGQSMLSDRLLDRPMRSPFIERVSPWDSTKCHGALIMRRGYDDKPEFYDFTMDAWRVCYEDEACKRPVSDCQDRLTILIDRYKEDASVKKKS